MLCASFKPPNGAPPGIVLCVTVSSVAGRARYANSQTAMPTVSACPFSGNRRDRSCQGRPPGWIGRAGKTREGRGSAWSRRYRQRRRHRDSSQTLVKRTCVILPLSRGRFAHTSLTAYTHLLASYTHTSRPFF